MINSFLSSLKRCITIVAVSIPFLFISKSYASEDPIISKLNAMNQQSEFQQAYDFALTHLNTHEGDSHFDLAYAIAAIETGHIAEGIFALDRLLLVNPNHSVAKLELARALYMQENYDRALQLFKQVRALEPPKLVRYRIDNYLAAIAKKTTIPPTAYRSFLELWHGYDSNANAGPDSQPELVFLTDEALRNGDQFQQIKLGGDIEHAYSPQHSLYFNANADFRYYQKQDNRDYNSLTFSGEHRWNLESQQFKLGAVMQKYNLDDKDYRDILGVNASWSKQLSKEELLKLHISASSHQFAESTWRDSRQTTLGVNYIFTTPSNWKPVYFTGAYVGREIPKVSGILADAEVDRFLWGANFGVQLTPSDKLTITPSILFQSSDYKAEDWIYAVKRDDNYSALNISTEWQASSNWTLLANYNIASADSNIELYEYERQQILLGIRYQFN